jgi:hypothetical protein
MLSLVLVCVEILDVVMLSVVILCRMLNIVMLCYMLSVVMLYHMLSVIVLSVVMLCHMLNVVGIPLCRESWSLVSCFHE